MAVLNARKKLSKSYLTGMIKLGCPSCKNIFGLDTKFMEKTSEINMRYTCPYCSVAIKSLDINKLQLEVNNV